MLPAYPLTLASAATDGATLTNSVTPTSILAGSAIATIPGGTLQPGSTLKLLLRGRVSTVATTPGTLTFDLRMGNTVISALGALPLNVTAQTNAAWELELLAVIRALGTGTTANALVTGRFTSRALVGSVVAANGGDMLIVLPDTAPAVGTGFDSTVSNALNVFATWSTANAANSITVHQAVVEMKL